MINNVGDTGEYQTLNKIAGMARVGFLGYGFFGFLWVNPLL